MIKIGVIYDEPIGIQGRFNYTINFINNHPLFVNHNVQLVVHNLIDSYSKINYSQRNSKAKFLNILRNKEIFESNELTSPFKLKTFVFNDEDFYFLKAGHNTSVPITNGSFLPFDIFESIFFFISRYEEIYTSKSKYNQAGWLKESEHTLINNAISHIPVVDRLIALLLKKLGFQVTDAVTTFDLTHDLDILKRFKNPFYYLRSLGASIIYKRGLKQMARDTKFYGDMVFHKLPDPYDVFDSLLTPSSHWKNKVLYIMTGGTSKYDNKYSLNNPSVKEIIHLALSRNYSIGLHPSYNAAFDPEMFNEEKDRLEKHLNTTIHLGRQHWLRFDWKVTPMIYESYGSIIDSSMGYNQHIGFRCGTGHPYHMYNFDNEQAYTWLEQPLALMDSSVFHMSKTLSKSITDIISTFLKSNGSNTHITMNFHNSNFDATTIQGRALAIIYKELLNKMN